MVRTDDQVRKDELLELVTTMSAEGFPLLTVDDFWRHWPDGDLRTERPVP
jgi:hypothetical protein